MNSAASNEPITFPSSKPEVSYPSALAELEAREASIARNLKGLDNSAQQEAIGLELIVIRDRKLYREAGIKSFEGYLDTRRNSMSRSRAYQLIRFAQETRRPTLAGQPVPTNERQARAARAQRDELDPFVQFWSPIFKYLEKKFLSRSSPEQTRFVEMLVLSSKVFAHQVEVLKEKRQQNVDNAQMPADP